MEQSDTVERGDYRGIGLTVPSRQTHRQGLSAFQFSVSCPTLRGYDEPETLSYQITLFGPIGADVIRVFATHCQDLGMGSPPGFLKLMCGFAQQYRCLRNNEKEARRNPSGLAATIFRAARRIWIHVGYRDGPSRHKNAVPIKWGLIPSTYHSTFVWITAPGSIQRRDQTGSCRRQYSGFLHQDRPPEHCRFRRP